MSVSRGKNEPSIEDLNKLDEEIRKMFEPEYNPDKDLGLDSHFHPDDIKWNQDQTRQKCLFVEFIKHNPDKAGEPLWLSCPCPKCTPRC